MSMVRAAQNVPADYNVRGSPWFHTAPYVLGEDQGVERPWNEPHARSGRLGGEFLRVPIPGQYVGDASGGTAIGR
jgi:hypothetical protein